MSRGDAGTRIAYIIINDDPQRGCGIRHVDERFALDVAWAYRFPCGETVVTGQNNDERLARQVLERQVRHLWFGSKKGHVDLASEKTARELRRCLTDKDHFDARQFVAEQSYGFREPIHLGSGQKAHDE